MEEIIRLEHINKIYHPGENEIQALSDVSLTVHKGEFVAIVGQSGSGKSTLMNLLGCLDTPTDGAYILEGSDVSTLSDQQLSAIRNRQIGFIFQGLNLIPSLTALENVELPLIYRGVGREERRRAARESLERVGLSNRMRHRPAEMSGGQQQRVAIAHAIAAHPPILLADEPTGNLDSTSGADVMDILRSLNRDGHTVILITHDSGIAATIDRVVHIQDGQIISDGTRVPDSV